METKQPFAQDAATPERKSTFLASVSQSPPKDSSIIASTANGKELTEKQQMLLERRGIDVDLAISLGWRRGPKGTIEIPYFRDGKEVNCKVRTIEGEKFFTQTKGGEQCLYNLDAIRGATTLVITEGEMDCLIALACGYNAVSVPNGAPSKEIGDHASEKYKYLTDIPKEINDIILATDGDKAGQSLMNDLALRLGRHRCRWVKYPEGCKDLNDIFLKEGKDFVRSSLDCSAYVKVHGLYRMDELPPLPEFEAFDVGIPSLAKNFRLRQGDLSVWTGIPGHGKTTVANHIAANMAINHNWNICFASFEQNPQTEHKRALKTLYGKDGAEGWINRHFGFIVPDDGDDSFDLKWLKDRMAAAVTQYGVKWIIIDPWNELDHEYDQREMNLTQYTGKAIKDLKKFAKRYMVHITVIAHPAKMKKNKDGKFPIPNAYDISDSAHWANKPDQVVIIHREPDCTLFRVAKCRYHYALGYPGDVELDYNEKTKRYS